MKPPLMYASISRALISIKVLSSTILDFHNMVWLVCVGAPNPHVRRDPVCVCLLVQSRVVLN
jgi:hypothetical protein